MTPRSTRKMVSCGDTSQDYDQWADCLGINKSSLSKRLRKGQTIQEVQADKANRVYLGDAE